MPHQFGAMSDCNSYGLPRRALCLGSHESPIFLGQRLISCGSVSFRSIDAPSVTGTCEYGRQSHVQWSSMASSWTLSSLAKMMCLAAAVALANTALCNSYACAERVRLPCYLLELIHRLVASHLRGSAPAKLASLCCRARAVRR